MNWGKKSTKAMLSNFLFPRNGQVVLSLLRLPSIAALHLQAAVPPQPEVGRAHVPLGAEAHVQGKVLVSQVVTGHRSLYQRPTDLNLL